MIFTVTSGLDINKGAAQRKLWSEQRGDRSDSPTLIIQGTEAGPVLDANRNSHSGLCVRNNFPLDRGLQTLSGDGG